MGDSTPDIQEWVSAVSRVLGLGGLVIDDGLVDTVLDLTADVAHGVSRPAAPVTAFLVGLALGRDGDLAAALRSRTAAVSALAATWPIT